MWKILLVLFVALAVSLPAPAVDAQAPLPLSINLVYQKSTGLVEVRGTGEPGTVVWARGASAVVGASRTFRLRTQLPISIVAVRKDHIRRLRIELPERAEQWLTQLSIYANLTKMQASVAGALTRTSHPPATVIVHHVEADSTLKAPLSQGAFHLSSLPLVPRTNTLEWAVRVGALQLPAPSVTVTVQ